MVASAVIGGTASEIAGGKFANGAMTAAFGRLYNEELSDRKVRPHDGKVVGAPHPDGRFSLEGQYRRNVNGTPRPHLGVDYASDIGDPISAAAGGEVYFVCPESTCTLSGNQITLLHSGGSGNVYTRYFHLNEILVAPGDSVLAGQQIGTLGTTGNAAGTSQPHLHFEVRARTMTGLPLDPEEWLKD